MPNTSAWVDTGFLVALFAKDDKHHTSAQAFLSSLGKIELHSIWPVVVEACFFLDTSGKLALLQWIERGALTLHNISTQDLPIVRNTLEKYQNLEPDFTDAALVTLGVTGSDALFAASPLPLTPTPHPAPYRVVPQGERG